MQKEALIELRMCLPFLLIGRLFLRRLMSHTSKHLGFKYVSGHLMGSGQQEKVSSQGIA